MDISCFKSERNYKYAQPANNGNPHGDDNKKQKVQNSLKNPAGGTKITVMFSGAVGR